MNAARPFTRIAAIAAGLLAVLLLPAIARAQSSALSWDDRARLDALRRSQAEQDEKARAERRALRQQLLRSAPLAEERNVLLGRWRIEGSGKPRPKDDFAQLMNIVTNPGGFSCGLLFGEGVTEFLPRTWASIDRSGNDSLGPISYRGDGKTHAVAIPDKGVDMLIFEVTGPNRIELYEGCALVRVGGPANAPATAPNAANAARAQGAARARSPADSGAGSGPNTSDLQVAAAPPTQPNPPSDRPPPEVCRQTLLDQLGKVGVHQVRQMIEARFRGAAEAKVPSSANLRIDARNSACDDPRVLATLYDFDAGGMLHSITFVWQRPAGPGPAPIFVERVKTLSVHHGLPAPQSPGRLQADTALGRLVLQDMPERSVLLEAYIARN